MLFMNELSNPLMEASKNFYLFHVYVTNPALSKLITLRLIMTITGNNGLELTYTHVNITYIVGDILLLLFFRFYVTTDISVV